MTQQARNLAVCLGERLSAIKFLIHDRDAKFRSPFDDMFHTQGIEVIQTPFRWSKANAFAEPWVRTVRAECLDWLLVFSRRHLERVLRIYVEHYNHARPHRSLDLRTPRTSLPRASPPMV